LESIADRAQKVRCKISEAGKLLKIEKLRAHRDERKYSGNSKGKTLRPSENPVN
jgi:hypothetical protein